jgi:hypothetical protein
MKSWRGVRGGWEDKIAAAHHDEARLFSESAAIGNPKWDSGRLSVCAVCVHFAAAKECLGAPLSLVLDSGLST